MPYIPSPYPTFTDLDGSPLSDGYIWFGNANTNPVTSSIPVYWNSSLSIAADQPIRTVNGYFSQYGTPGQIYTAVTAFSILVQNSKGQTVFSNASVTPQLTQADVNTAVATKLSLTGGTMTGPIVLPGNPTLNLEAAPKQYVDSAIVAGNFLPKSGGTMTGAIVLAADPTTALQASTKQYADTKVALAGGTMTGLLTLSGNPSANLQAAPKQYVDSAASAVDRIKAWVNFSGTPLNGTYVRSGTLITVTMTAHGMVSGMLANLTFTSGTATSGTYAVQVLTVNTFTITDTASGSTTGNVTLNSYIRSQYNVLSINDSAGVGRYTINFQVPLSNQYYVVTGNASYVNTFDASDNITISPKNLTTSGFDIQASDASVNAYFDAFNLFICVIQ